MLYGGLGVWAMAGISFLIFNARPLRLAMRRGRTREDRRQSQ